MRLPDRFDWRSYESLMAEHDISVWASLFSMRDPENDASHIKSVVGPYFSPETNFTRTTWRDGVLFHGYRGHSTHEYLREVLEMFWGNYPDDVGVPDQSRFKTLRTAENIDKYNMLKRKLFDSTLEFAINLRMPKELLIKEIEKIIDTHQEELHPQKFEVLKNATTTQWARGLAIFDLLADGVEQGDIQRLLCPVWNKSGEQQEIDGKAPEDSWKKQYDRAYNSVRPLIYGGWRTLCGDPIGFDEAPKIHPKIKKLR